MQLRTLKTTLLSAAGIAVVAAALCLACSPRARKLDVPTGYLTLAHFREIGIPYTDSTFGVREWRYAGDPAVGGKPKSFTTFWLGSHQLDTRLPAPMIIVPAAVAGMSLIGLLCVSLLNSIRGGPAR